MVREVNDLYECEECGFRYRERELAEDCERFCQEHNACNPELAKEAVNV